MIRRLSREQRGFTLIEILVVLLIIGVLAAIALPMFLGKRENADDADAKSNARNLVSQVNSCFASTEDYRSCDTVAELGPTGLDWGTGPSQVRVTNATRTTYDIEAVSRATSAGVNHTFTISITGSGATHSCRAGAGDNDGGCHGGSW